MGATKQVLLNCLNQTISTSLIDYTAKDTDCTLLCTLLCTCGCYARYASAGTVCTNESAHSLWQTSHLTAGVPACPAWKGVRGVEQTKYELDELLYWSDGRGVG